MYCVFFSIIKDNNKQTMQNLFSFMYVYIYILKTLYGVIKKNFEARLTNTQRQKRH